MLVNLLLVIAQKYCRSSYISLSDQVDEMFTLVNLILPLPAEAGVEKQGWYQ